MALQASWVNGKKANTRIPILTVKVCNPHADRQALLKDVALPHLLREVSTE